jgi:hypothetical protein
LRGDPGRRHTIAPVNARVSLKLFAIGRAVSLEITLWRDYDRGLGRQKRNQP